MISYQNDLVPSILFRLITTGFGEQSDNINRQAYLYSLALKKTPHVFGKFLLNNFFENRITQLSIRCIESFALNFF